MFMAKVTMKNAHRFGLLTVICFTLHRALTFDLYKKMCDMVIP